MRKYKLVKEKKVTYPTEEWKEVEHRAAELSMKTGTYIRQISVKGQLTILNAQNVAPILNALRIIGNNINQIAKKLTKPTAYTQRILKKYERRTICFAIR